MGKKLIITEKPSVARDFANVLNVNGKKNGYIENNEYVISWCYGHLVEMAYPESYDKKYGTWNLEDLPFLPEVYKYQVVESAAEQYKVVNSLLHREDVDTVYWAGDSGKEGQTIEENIRMYGGVREGMNEVRVWIDSQTDDEILRGIREAKPMSDYDLLGKSGIMRTIEDYSLGINFSRALSVKYGRLINNAAATSSYTAIALGRVMTCVLGMVVRREREIRDFKEDFFYRVAGSFSDANFSAEWKAVEGSKYYESPLLYKENGFKKREDADKLIESLKDKTAEIQDIETGVSKKKAPLLFNLAELQSECSKIFKISPSEALQVVQDLYERKLTTYPRTDARVLSSAIAKEIYKNINGLKRYDAMAGFANEILENKKHIGIEKTQYTDDSKVTDHYAIIPTGFTGGIENLDLLHKNIYNLICKRFLAIFYPPAEYSNIKIHLTIDTEHFFTSAKVLQKPGYMKVTGIPSTKENDESDENDSCSKEEMLALAQTLKKGDIVSSNGYIIKEGKTSPPKRYTSGNLILAMENAGNLIEDEELREQIKNTGIGTSATRGDILEKLVRIKYLNRNNKTQIITPENLGEMIYEVVDLTVPSLLNPEMTASWEKGLEGIINGSVDNLEYRKKLEDYIRKETNKMINNDLTRTLASRINPFTGKDSKGLATRKALNIKCPQCGGELTTTAFGYGCSNYFDENIKCNFSLGKVAGLDIEENDFIELITNGKTRIIEGFKAKNNKPFKAELKLSQNEEGKYQIGFDFENIPTEYVESFKCPVCASKMVATGYGFSCEKHNQEENGCYFSIGSIAGRQLTEAEAAELVNNGHTDILKGFKSKAKKNFNARLKLVTNEEHKISINFDFDDIEPDYVEGVTCPDCGGKIRVLSNGFGCSSFDNSNPDSCKFFIGKIAQKSISAASVKELLSDGKTKTIRGFKSKSGKKFDACLVLNKNEDGKSVVAFDFDSVEAKVIKDVVCPVCKSEIVQTHFGFACKNYDRNSDTGCKFNIGTIASVKITETHLKELINDGITTTISGFVAKTGMKFDAKLAFDKDENNVIKGCKFVFENTDTVMENLICPRCNGKIIKGRGGYRCENYSSDAEGRCRFFIGKIAGLEIPEEQIRKLFADKKTDRLSGFVSKAGNQFEAVLQFDESYNIVFNFDSQ